MNYKLQKATRHIQQLCIRGRKHQQSDDHLVKNTLSRLARHVWKTKQRRVKSLTDKRFVNIKFQVLV